MSAQLCASLIGCVERSREELEEELREAQAAAERGAEEIVTELQREINRLKTRSTDTVHLLHTEDSLHLLQVHTHTQP